CRSTRQLAEAEGGIREIQGAVGLVTQVVRTVEAFAFETVRENRALVVLFEPHHVSVAVRAVCDAPLLIQRDAVRAVQRHGRVTVIELIAGVARIGAGEAAFFQKDGDFAVGRPLVDHIRGNVAEDQVRQATRVPPDGPFGEAKSVRKLFNLRAGRNQSIQSRIEPDDLPAAILRRHHECAETCHSVPLFTAAAKIARQMRIMIPLPIIKTDSLKTAWAQLPEEAKPETREVTKT